MKMSTTKAVMLAIATTATMILVTSCGDREITQSDCEACYLAKQVKDSIIGITSSYKSN